MFSSSMNVRIEDLAWLHAFVVRAHYKPNHCAAQPVPLSARQSKRACRQIATRRMFDEYWDIREWIKMNVPCIMPEQNFIYITLAT